MGFYSAIVGAIKKVAAPSKKAAKSAPTQKRAEAPKAVAPTAASSSQQAHGSNYATQKAAVKPGTGSATTKSSTSGAGYNEQKKAVSPSTALPPWVTNQIAKAVTAMSTSKTSAGEGPPMQGPERRTAKTAPQGPHTEPQNPVAKPGKASDDVAALHDAMAGFGTDEAALFAALKGKSTTQLTEMKAAYKSRYGKDLESALRSDLSGGEEDAALAILARQDPETDCSDGGTAVEIDADLKTAAAGLHDAVDGAGTDDPAVFALLENRSPAELTELKLLYAEEYGTTLESDLRGDLSGAAEREAIALLDSNRADAVFAGIQRGIGVFSDDEDKIIATLSKMDEETRLAVIADPRFARTVNTLKLKLSGVDQDVTEALLAGDVQGAKDVRTADTLLSEFGGMLADRSSPTNVVASTLFVSPLRDGGAAVDDAKKWSSMTSAQTMILKEGAEKYGDPVGFKAAVRQKLDGGATPSHIVRDVAIHLNSPIDLRDPFGTNAAKKYNGSPQHQLYGKTVEYLSGGAMSAEQAMALNPSGGIIGGGFYSLATTGDLSSIGADYVPGDPSSLMSVVTRHAVYHDALGFIRTEFEVGPGYSPDKPGSSTSGQASGITFQALNGIDPVMKELVDEVFAGQ